jgi:hypothetical protein
LGVVISPQGLAQRFHKATATCLEQLLGAAVQTLVQAEAVAIPLVARFSGVYVLDSSLITLPDSLASVWPGCGGRVPQGSAASLKLHVRLDLVHGRLEGPVLTDARVHDRTGAQDHAPLPTGSLRLADLGYFDLDDLAEVGRQGGYWLSRVKSQVKAEWAGRWWTLAALLRTQPQTETEVDLAVRLGTHAQVPTRLLAVRVPPAVAQAARRHLRRAAKREGRTPSADRLALCDWVLLATNAPADLLSLDEALALARARWQIELLFKLWKQHGQVDTSRSAEPWRVLSEVYAKLVAMLVQHWALLVSGGWQLPDKSLVKAAACVRVHALLLATALPDRDRLAQALSRLAVGLARTCRLNPRKRRPNTYQVLLDPTLAGLA